MSLRRRTAIGAATLLALAVGAWCWREATRIDTVIITVPDADGFFAVWCQPAHPDVVEVHGRVARFSIPQDGLLRARSMTCLNDWHTERHVGSQGEAVEDVHGLGCSVSSEWSGTIYWWYRGAKTDGMYSSQARSLWLSRKGVVR